MAFTSVSGFLPSQSGFHFSNGNWAPDTAYPVVTLPIVGTVGAGGATNGLCGGFVLAALDLFLHSPRLFPPANTEADRPPAGSTLFSYITDRLIDSWGTVAQGPYANVFRTIQWIQTADAAVISSVINTEWPKIKQDIDMGKPSPLSLVEGPRRGSLLDVDGIVQSLHNCHQVLAYAYQVDNTNTLTLLVYDCNDPFNDSSAISLNLGNPATTITAPAISQKLGGVEVRGFFRTDYALHDASSIAITTGVKWDWRRLDKPAGVNIRTSMSATSAKDTPTSAERPHVFLEGNDGNLWCHYSDGNNWHWINMYLPNIPGLKLIGCAGAVSVVDTPTSPGRPHVFVAANDGNIWCRWSNGSAWSWTNMGQPSGAKIRALMGAVNARDTPTAPDRPHVFVECDDYNLWCLWWSGSAWSWANMSRPNISGLKLVGSAGTVSVMDTLSSPARPHLFVTANDGNIWCRWSSGSAWFWTNMGQPGGAKIRALLGVVNAKDTPTAPDRPHLFVEGDDYNLWCLWWSGTAWGWAKMDKPPTANIKMSLGAFVVRDAANAPKRPHLFVVGNDYNLWCRYSDGASWHWLNMGKPNAVNIRASLGAVTVTTNTTSSPERPYVFFEGDDYYFWYRHLG